jgi:hypothetical protein
MANLFNKSFFAFMARLAIICNFAFVLSLMKMLLKWFKMPDFLANFIAVLGLEMSPVVNICFAIWLLGLKIRKTSIEIPVWQTIMILCMLLIQILFATI